MIERVVAALEPHMPVVWPGDESEVTPEECREMATGAARAAVAAVVEELREAGGGFTQMEACAGAADFLEDAS